MAVKKNVEQEVNPEDEKELFKFESENKYLFVNFEEAKVEVQFMDGKYETTNKAVADHLLNVLEVNPIR
jgi:hypothetical protein